MVQRKASHKLGSQTKSKNEPVRHQRNRPSYHQQDSRTKGGGDTKKEAKVKSTKISGLQSAQVQFNQATMHKRSPAIKVSDQLPNYMKPTSSSDARKEKFKVTNHSPTTNDRIRGPRHLSNLNYSEPSTSPPDGSGLKHVKVLKRKPSLKQVRPWTKKSLGIALCPKLNANRATSSSTLKDSKFLKASDLNTGGTEAEGTSVMHVCPYTYCSLNEHGHKPLPPLKSFLSSRRKLLKTQKSMKVKGVSPFRKRGLGKDEKEEETGQAVLGRAPSALEILMEEVANDFFVQIYTKPCKQNVKSVNCDEGCLQENNNTENSEVLNIVQLTEDDKEGANCEEEDGRNQKDEIHECNSVISFKEDLDPNSDLSIEEMDVMTSCLEYISSHQQDQDKEGNSASMVRKEGEKLSLEWQVMDGFVKDTEGFAGSAIKVPFEASEMNLEEDADTFPDKKTCYSEATDDGLGPLFGYLFENDDADSGLSLNAEITSVSCEIDEADLESSFEAYEVAECGHTAVSEGISSDRNDVYSDEENGSPAINSVSCDYNVQDQRTDFLISKPIEAETYKENDPGDSTCSKDSNLTESFLGHLEASKGAEKGRETENDLSKQNGEGEVSEAVDLEVNHILDNGNVKKTILNVGIKGEDDGNEKVEDASSSFSMHFSGSDEGSTARENDATGNHIQTEMEIKIYKHDDEESSTLVKIHLSFNDPSDEVDKGDDKEKSEEKHEEANDTGGISQATEEDCYEVDHAVQWKNNLEICLTARTEGPEEDRTNDFEAALSNQAPSDGSGKQKAKISIVRSRRTEEEDQMKVFNPRGPNFLPVEPDPAAEKVDLRHQEMDERKNAEEWMTDYALQQAVTKLAPARERKVELLVEAFETVTPMPMCEKAMQRTSQEFDHARPLQACS